MTFSQALKVFSSAVVLLTAISLPAQETHLTIYNQDLAVVRQDTSISSKPGVFTYDYENVTSRIDPTSVSLQTLSGKPLSILEQSYVFDLISDQKVLEKSLGMEVTFFESYADQDREFTGKLLSVQGGRPVLETEEGIYVGNPDRFILKGLPKGLAIRPTLKWLLKGRQSGEQRVALSYMTGGLSWNANYVLGLAPDEKSADLTAWVTIHNQSGTTFENAKVKLMAGDVNRARAPGVGATPRRAMAEAANGGHFDEKAFFEYHLYTLNRPSTLRDREVKQIEFAQGHDIPVKKVYTYDGAGLGNYSGWFYGRRENRDLGLPSQKKVAVRLELNNSSDSGLGIPLPRGVVRVTMNDTDGSAQLIGEEWIDHTPRDETLHLTMGNAFDLVGERKQTAFKTVVPKHEVEESFRIILKNHKDEAVTIRVVEVLYRWSEAEITKSSAKYERVDRQTVVFPVKVPARGQASVDYTVRYRW